MTLGQKCIEKVKGDINEISLEQFQVYFFPFNMIENNIWDTMGKRQGYLSEGGISFHFVKFCG